MQSKMLSQQLGGAPSSKYAPRHFVKSLETKMQKLNAGNQ